MGRKKKETSYFDTHISWNVRMPRKMVAELLECFHKEKLYREANTGKKFYLTDVMKDIVGRYVKEYAITEAVRNMPQAEGKLVQQETVQHILSLGEPKE